jgi:hypothetical protein
LISESNEAGGIQQIEVPERQLRKMRRLSMIFFWLGVLIGVFLLGASVYADFESELFDVSLETKGRLRQMYCPVMLSARETGKITILIDNPTDKPATRHVLATVTRGHFTYMNLYEFEITLEPGEQRTLSWDVTAHDATYGNLILAKVMTMANLRQPLRRGSCGILVLNLPGWLKGGWFIAILLVITVIFILIGMRMWWLYGRPNIGWRGETSRIIYLLGGVILVGLALSMLGIWELAAGAFYIAVLAIGVSLPHFLFSQRADQTSD